MGAEAFFELALKALEQLNVLGFFAGKLQKSSHRIIVTMNLMPRVIDDERQNELFHQSKDAQIRVAPDLIQQQLLFIVQKRESLHAREALRHERLRKIEPLSATDNVLNAPANRFRRCQSRLICVTMIHHLQALPSLASATVGLSPPH